MSNLRDLRTARSLSQKDLAQASGIRQATISAIERGQATPHAGTIALLAGALGCTPAEIAAAVRSSRIGEQTQNATPAKTWRFLDKLDNDLRRGLTEELIATWTHTSTSLEGNTISQGDTLFVLREGLTVSGHTLREHQELQGHAQAVALVDRILCKALTLTASTCHECHRLIQTGVHNDVLAPIGKWKVESNGTQALRTKGPSQWHDYALPEHVPALMGQWFEIAVGSFAEAPRSNREHLLEFYTQLHLGFTAIHPYADGNGRMARLLANLPILQGGQPPLLIAKESRRRYLQLIGDFSLMRGAPRPGTALVPEDATVDMLRKFFAEQWQSSLHTVDEFHARQKRRQRSTPTK
jgi:Fic family protein/DNA-binding XRE family transcriptional regulator